eukprot:TRINITY_DN76726_c0_g1_i1.p1 TRINITY_DN76726_c0_g1~~TRINITY_DN76726_c0_g1_i1.p1  ORF type:complete len:188 (-),score=25.32 TRINITY_DN76726_c0_g1_i1:56-586(-)
MAAEEDYARSFSEYLSLLKKPKLNGAMFQCQQNDWGETFQAWNIIYLIVSILVYLVLAAFTVLRLTLYLQVFSLLYLLISVFIGCITAFLLTHLGWFCIVKKRGCCGCIGYAIWAFVYFAFVVWPLLPSAAGYGNNVTDVSNLICLVELVPAIYMLIAICRLWSTAPDMRQVGLVS